MKDWSVPTLETELLAMTSDPVAAKSILDKIEWAIYRDGEHSEEANWHITLTDLGPLSDDFGDVNRITVAAYITRLQANLREMHEHWMHSYCDAECESDGFLERYEALHLEQKR